MKVYRCIIDKELQIAQRVTGGNFLSRLGKQRALEKLFVSLPESRRTNTNTHPWKDQSCIHFFLFAESAQYYMQEKFSYRIHNLPKTVGIVQSEIPTKILRDALAFGHYAGAGCHGGIRRGGYFPLPEFKITMTQYNIKMMKQVSQNIADDWKRSELYADFLRCVPEKYIDCKKGLIKSWDFPNRFLDDEI